VQLNQLECYVVVQEQPLHHLPLDKQYNNYYTGASGRFSADIRRAKLYPTDKAARRAYPFTQSKLHNLSYSKDLTVHQVVLHY
jgi:hypothetical protein